MDSIYENVYEGDDYSTDYGDAYLHIQQLDKQIRKLKKKKKRKGKGKKCKLKQKIRRLEMEQEQLKQFVVFFAYQYKGQVNQQPWWQIALCNTLPKAFDLATATVNKLPNKTQPLYLTDGSDRK